MAQSLTDKILAALFTRLNASKPTGVTVSRTRRRPSEPGELPLITVRPHSERVDKIGTGIRVAGVERYLRVSVIVRCAGNDAALDPIRTYAIETVTGNQSLDGLCIEIIEVEHLWLDDDASDADYIQDEIFFDVRYQTSRTSPGTK